MPWPMRIGPEPSTTTFWPEQRRRFVLGLERAVEVRRDRLELGGARVDHLVGRPHVPVAAAIADAFGQLVEQRADLTIGEAESLGAARQRRRQLGACSSCRSKSHDVLQLVQEERVDARPARTAFRASRHAASAAISAHSRWSLGSRIRRSRSAADQAGSSHSRSRLRTSSERTAFCSAASNERSMAIASPVDFICVPRRAVAVRELVERPARDLDHQIVERRLERGRRALGDGVGDLVQALADGDLGRDAGDRIAGRLGRQRRRAADARVDLDHGVLPRGSGRARTARCSRRSRPARE